MQMILEERTRVLSAVAVSYTADNVTRGQQVYVLPSCEFVLARAARPN
jgi:hypothetical protein